jgi:Flp pilus assembly protein TadG
LKVILHRVSGLRRLWADNGAAQMVEFAVSLPLLIVFVVGIFDFSGAYTLKQQLASAAREGARVAAADPATDLGNGGINCTTLVVPNCPASISDAFQVVDNYLIAQKINDCGIKPSSATQPAPLTWSFTATSATPTPCIFTLTIDRGYFINSVGGGSTPDCTPQAVTPGTQLIETCVLISYQYNWHFNSVITVLVPGARYSPTSMLTTKSVALNEN